MKKFTILFLFFSLAVSAQENFPYKRPLLMLNKVVIPTTHTDPEGFDSFYSDEGMHHIYKPLDKYSFTSTEESLLGREFNVVAVDSFTNWKNKYEYLFKLQDNAGEIIYYKYDKDSAYDWTFPFVVKGGLDLPEGFYCDYVTKGTYSYDAKVGEIWLRQHYSYMTKKNDMSTTFTFFDTFKTNSINSVTLILENNKTIVQETNPIYSSPHNNKFKYTFTIILEDKDLELLKANKLTGIKIGDNVHIYTTGQKLSGILKCMGGLPLIQKP